MKQIRKRVRLGSSLAREPGALIGYATMFAATPDPRLATDIRYQPLPLFLPPCPHRMLTAPKEPTQAGEPRLLTVASTLAYLRDQVALFLASARSWYRDWRERQAAHAAWETLDERTLKDIGVSRDAMGEVERPVSCWERCDTVL